MTTPDFVQFDNWAGGRNTIKSPDVLRNDELLDATNLRLTAVHGAITKRSGTQRIHQTAIGSGNPVTGIVQWDFAGTKQIVAISDGKLYHKTTALGQFAEVVPTQAFSTSTVQSIATMRQSTSGAPLRLYIADGNLQRWTGSAVTKITGTDDTPSIDLITPYHTRMFARNTNFLQFIYWSKVGDPEFFTVLFTTDGGFALVDTLAGEEIKAIQVLGSSLMIATEDSIIRFTGYSADDIQISQDTEGISAGVGIVGPLALSRVESFVPFISDRGPYIAVESGVEPMGIAIEPDFDALDRTNLSKAVVAYHRGRKEIWFAVAGSGDSGLNKTVYVYSTRLSAWSGPFTYSFGINCLTRFEDANGDEFLIAGCSDGFVRHMDTGSKDDVLFDGTGGATYTMLAELAPQFFNVGPSVVNATRTASLQADINLNKLISLKMAFDDNPFRTFLVKGKGTGRTEAYKIQLGQRGRRLRIQITDSSDDISTINGLLIHGYAYGRI